MGIQFVQNGEIKKKTAHKRRKIKPKGVSYRKIDNQFETLL